MYLFWKHFPFSNRSARYNLTYRELTLQYIATDRWKEANRLISGIMRTSDAFSGFELLPLISAGLQHGLKVEKMVEVAAGHDKRVKESGLVEFIGDVVMSSDNPVQTLLDIFQEIKPPETEHSGQKTALSTEFVRALLSPLSSGRLKPDDGQTARLTSAAYSYLDFIFKETDSDPWIMNELFEIFSGAGIRPEPPGIRVCSRQRRTPGGAVPPHSPMRYGARSGTFRDA